MGAAAQQRGDKVIRQQVAAAYELNDKRANEDAVRALQIAEDCNIFVRDAMAYLNEPRGLRELSVTAAKKKRGWEKRNAAVVSAHAKWVDVPHGSNAYVCASVKRAQAVYKLLDFALGGWTVPAHITVPRAATV
jgi:hypothetical protein